VTVGGLEDKAPCSRLSAWAYVHPSLPWCWVGGGVTSCDTRHRTLGLIRGQGLCFLCTASRLHPSSSFYSINLVAAPQPPRLTMIPLLTCLYSPPPPPPPCSIGEFWYMFAPGADMAIQLRLFKYQRASSIGAVAVKAGAVVVTLTCVNSTQGATQPPLLRVNGTVVVPPPPGETLLLGPEALGGDDVVVRVMSGPVEGDDDALLVVSFQFRAGHSFGEGCRAGSAQRPLGAPECCSLFGLVPYGKLTCHPYTLPLSIPDSLLPHSFAPGVYVLYSSGMQRQYIETSLTARCVTRLTWPLGSGPSITDSENWHPHSPPPHPHLPVESSCLSAGLVPLPMPPPLAYRYTCGVPVSDALTGNTAGLCGTADGDPSNDFTTPNGTVLPLTAALAFGESWRTSQSPATAGGPFAAGQPWDRQLSIFHPEDPMDESYTDPTHVPMTSLGVVPAALLRAAEVGCAMQCELRACACQTPVEATSTCVRPAVRSWHRVRSSLLSGLESLWMRDF
jgi:hypothetical protein